MIIFVDDDRRYIKDYVEELESRKYTDTVIHKYDIDDAFNFIVENHHKIQILVLDMMMPSGNIFQHKDEDNGRRTGIFFVEAVEKKIGKINFPLIVFTHVNIDSLELKHTKLQKEDYDVFEFADYVKELII